MSPIPDMFFRFEKKHFDGANTPGKQEEDHAGHLIADIFGGSPELDNLVTQSKIVNQKTYRRIERKWQTALEKGEKLLT